MAARTITLNVIGDVRDAERKLDHLAGHTEDTGRRGVGAFHGLLGIANQSGAFGPLLESLDSVDVALDKVKEHGRSVGGTLAAGGLGLAGIGGVLTKLAGPEEQAKAQLKQAIENTGASYDEFEKNIERNIKSNEGLGHSSKDSMEAIRVLTQATGSAKDALGEMGVVADLAAAKHVSLSDAAGMLARVHGGANRVLKEFGITAEKATDTTKKHAAAQTAAQHADESLAKAKEALVMLQERQSAKTKLTIADHQAMQRAEERVTEAAGKANDAHDKLAATQTVVVTKSQAAEVNIGRLGAKLDGQASAAAKTFSGHMKAMTVTIEDGAAKLGQKYGPALTAVGTGITALGGIVNIFSRGQKAAAGVADVLTASTEAEAGAMEGAAAAEGLALGPILLIIAAVAVVGFAIYELATHWKQVWGWIKDVAADAWAWIKKHIDLILTVALGPLGLAIAEFGKHWHDIWDGIKKAVADVWKFLGPIFDKIGGGLKAIGGFLGKASGLSGLGSLLHFADGGWVPGAPGQPSLAVVHGGEFVVSRDMLAGSSASSGGGVVSQGGGWDRPLTVVLELDGKEIGRATAPHVRTQLLRVGMRNPGIGLT